MPLTEIIELEHEQILLEAHARRIAAERRHAAPGCPWGCDGSGWHEIALCEYGPLDGIAEVHPAVVVLPWGLLLFPCECNSAGVGVRRWPGWYRN